jgi:hypothetical protein
MTDNQVEVTVVVAAREDAEELARLLEEISPGSAHVANTAELDGDLAQWILLAQSTITTLASLVPPLLALLDRRRVRSVTVGDVHIENPTREDVEALLQRAGLRDA